MADKLRFKIGFMGFQHHGQASPDFKLIILVTNDLTSQSTFSASADEVWKAVPQTLPEHPLYSTAGFTCVIKTSAKPNILYHYVCIVTTGHSDFLMEINHQILSQHFGKIGKLPLTFSSHNAIRGPYVSSHLTMEAYKHLYWKAMETISNFVLEEEGIK